MLLFEEDVIKAHVSMMEYFVFVLGYSEQVYMCISCWVDSIYGYLKQAYLYDYQRLIKLSIVCSNLHFSSEY